MLVDEGVVLIRPRDTDFRCGWNGASPHEYMLSNQLRETGSWTCGPVSSDRRTRLAPNPDSCEIFPRWIS